MVPRLVSERMDNKLRELRDAGMLSTREAVTISAAIMYAAEYGDEVFSREYGNMSSRILLNEMTVACKENPFE
ncbi:MAG: hypothetical protein HN929_14290 [Chloroflexi bacterium]|nr:hypothetical protein [Chloroflexota bacterium]